MKKFSLLPCGIVLGCSLLAAPAAFAQFYTAPFGPGGTWNLYEVTNNAVNTTPATATWKAAHQAAIAKTATLTGVSGVAGNTMTGHLVAIGSWAENAMVSLMALRHTNSSNVWIGLCDSDDADLGGAGWADAQPGTTSDQWFWAGFTAGGTGTGPNGWAKFSEGGSYQAFFTGEPNGAAEDCVELRTDGRWNDNAHNTAATVRRSVIEWEIGSATPVAGAEVLSPFFTAPHGAGGKWNLYMIVGEADTWLNAHTRATALEAQQTGLAALAGNNTRGHLLQISSRTENSFGVSVMNEMLTFNNTIAVNGATTNTWLGLTDSDDAGLTAVEAATSRTTNWIWAGTAGGTGPNNNLRIEESLEAPANTNVIQYFFNATTNEPNNSTGTANAFPFGEDAAELRGDGRWNDLPHKIGPANNAAATIARRYIIEFDIDSLTPIAGARVLPNYFTARTGAGNTWNLYYLDNTMGTWQDFGTRWNDPMLNTAAFTGIPALTGNTTAGHLVELADQYEHGLAYRLCNFQGCWIGLTDSETFGGQESGNAANNPTNQVQPFWVWSGTASAAAYRRWNAGNPDDSGSNEDACEMISTGFMNDNQINNVNGAIRRCLVEWDIQSATPIAGVAQVDPLMAGTRTLANAAAPGVWAVKEIYDPVQGNWFTALRHANAAVTNGRVAEGTFPVINFNDRAVTPATAINYPGWGDTGLFGGDLPLVGDLANNDDNNIARIAATKLVVTDEDDYTINIHSDDGVALRIAGQTFTQAFGLAFIDGIDKGTMFVPYGTGDTNARAAVHLTPGTYDVEVVSFEGTSGSAWEISWARGIYATDEAGAGRWSLLGNPASSYPAPLLPANIANAPGYDDGVWGLHTVSGAGTIASLTDALAALQNAAGTHAYGSAPVISHSDADAPGTGGIFAGELELPGAAAGNDNDFAVHGQARLVIATAGQYTICFKGSEWVALRMNGQTWQNVGGEAGIDPADASSVFSYRNNSANNINLSEFTSRAVVNLPAGCHEIEFVTGDRDGAFFMELYARSGNVINTAEYATTGTANGGLAIPSGDYRLIGYKGDGTLGSLGVTSAGWVRMGTTPAATAAAAAPAGWPGTSIAGFDTWIQANGVTTDATSRDTVNERDPQNPTTDAGIPNGRDMWRQTTIDDNYHVEQYDATLVVPEAGTYSIGWQGDDGGYIEVRGLPAGTGFSRLEAQGVPTPAIVAASDGTVNGRLQLEVGGGNTRTMARITFPGDGSVTYPAQYPIRSLHFEGNGGCYWEIFAGPASGYGRMVTLLQRDAGSAAVADVDGIQLIGPDIDVLSVAMPGGSTFAFTFRSVPGLTYTIQRSLNLADWISLGTITAAGTSTTYTSDPLDLLDTRFYYRARK